MIFTSLDFAFFLPAVFLIYWLLNSQSVKWQNLFLVLASYVFYGWWDWRFLALILFSSLLDFIIAQAIENAPGRRQARAYLALTLITNLGLLMVFKYFNFFAAQLNQAWSFFGWQAPVGSLNIILPVGISFYTFQTMSYSIDVYRKRLEPCKDLITFLGYVSFFPQLVAGPIERATNLLPQFQLPRKLNVESFKDGLRQILWGMFKKLAIADACAEHVNFAFDHTSTLGSASLLIGAVLFAFQIYGDFSGYSDMAIGISKLFGFQLRQNFHVPYFSRDMGEFWRRWHISLSSWFKDYVYIPLGGSRVGPSYAIRNIMVVFILSGLWHGANWTYISWGILNAMLFLPLFVMAKHRDYTGNIAENRIFPGFHELLSMCQTFALVCILWIIFRAESLSHASSYIFRLATGWTDFNQFYLPKMPLASISVMLVLEWMHRDKSHGLQIDYVKWPTWSRWALYYVLLLIILMMNSPSNDFIYFQF